MLDSEGFAVQEQTFSTDAAGIAEAVVGGAGRQGGAPAGPGPRGRRARGQVHVELRAHGGGADGDDTGPWLQRRAPLHRRAHQPAGHQQLRARDSTSDCSTSTPYNITLLSSDEPAGWRLPAGQTKTIGGTDGVPLEWAGVPDDEERPETLLVIAATRRSSSTR